MQETNEYDDIIDLPHHTSSTRTRMAAIDRAAQFSPFAALTGYDAAVKETARLTDERIELDENRKAMLDEKLRMIVDRMDESVEITVTYFMADDRKCGGAYIRKTGVVKRIDEFERTVIFSDKTKISIDDIYEIDIAE